MTEVNASLAREAIKYLEDKGLIEVFPREGRKNSVIVGVVKL